MIEKIGTQYKVKIETQKVLLLCDESYYYSDPKTIPRGVTWSGRPCLLFNSISEAEQHITDNNLTKYIQPDLL